MLVKNKRLNLSNLLNVNIDHLYDQNSLAHNITTLLYRFISNRIP